MGQNFSKKTSKESLGAVKIGDAMNDLPLFKSSFLQKVDGICNLHGNFTTLAFFNNHGSPLHEVLCPHCMVAQQSNEVRLQSAVQAKRHIKNTLNDANIPPLVQKSLDHHGQLIDDTISPYASRALRIIQSGIVKSNPYHFLVSGSKQISRTFAGCLLLSLFARSNTAQSGTSIRFLPLEEASVFWTPYKAEERLEQWVKFPILFVDNFSWEEYPSSFQNFLLTLFRYRSLRNRSTIFSREIFDDNTMEYLRMAGADNITVELGDLSIDFF